MSEIKLTERQGKIVKLIMRDPSISAKQMSETLSVTARTVERDISVLKRMGILTRNGKDNDGEWVILIDMSL
ncbi:MAG: HTH domain-containing protein [Bacteroidales bacterium]|nr:HTH domain-containing protein [Bacteroidales bacterium]